LPTTSNNNQEKSENADIEKGGPATTETYDSLVESIRQLKAYITKLTNTHKEEIKRLYTKYNNQKEFISIAAHELRSPITPILGALELMEYEFEEEGKKDEIILKKERFDTILRNAKRLERLASEILDVSRINDKSLILKREYFNLNEVVLDAIEDYRQQIKKSKTNTQLSHELKSKQIEEEEEEEKVKENRTDLFVYADKSRITQVIYNLLDNAIRFTPDGIVSVLVMKNNQDNNTDEEVTFSIKDAGTGIHPDILPNLFSIFTTKSDTGTGLGLFISKNIIEAHGGQMWGENNINEKGAKFSFSLPLQRR
jgi:signal transduction histidine kinase